MVSSVCREHQPSLCLAAGPSTWMSNKHQESNTPPAPLPELSPRHSAPAASPPGDLGRRSHSSCRDSSGRPWPLKPTPSVAFSIATSACPRTDDSRHLQSGALLPRVPAPPRPQPGSKRPQRGHAESQPHAGRPRLHTHQSGAWGAFLQSTPRSAPRSTAPFLSRTSVATCAF